MSAADLAMKVENLSKRYLIGHETAGRGQETFRDAIVRGARQIGATAGQMARGGQLIQGEVEEFWALSDVSFDVPRGEVVGIIGRNGAGKSTLLKILSRITEPTKGRVTINGRVSSLLEVGTGFHPELTGRENIYLNGAILGMGKAEIRSKFDEIVEFAEVERFLDTPVKRYSSGMYVRLAFAVAAHLEPEILIVDEVLAVGDTEFQKKCLGKMSEVAGGGRTVLFVSHNLGAVRRLCRTAVLLEKGTTSGIQSCDAAIDKYLSTGSAEDSPTWTGPGQYANDYFTPVSLSANATAKGRVEIEVVGDLHTPHPDLVIALSVSEKGGDHIFWTTQRDVDPDWAKGEPGRVKLTCELPAAVLNEGMYAAELVVFVNNQFYLIEQYSGPRVFFAVEEKSDNRRFWTKRREGPMAPALPWSTRALQPSGT